MSPLNYLGSAPGPGLSMPAGMPGSGSPQDPTMSADAAQGMMGPPPTPTPAAGLMGPAPGLGGVGMIDPAGRQYDVVTQEDGSLLLHLKNPDGSRGPVVKIIPPIKPRNPGA